MREMIYGVSWAAALLILLGLPPLAGAQNPRLAPEQAGVLHSLDRLIGAEVRGPAQERTGEIRDLLVDMKSGRIGLAVIAAGGVVGLGDTTHFVPWKALAFSPDGTFSLAVDREKMAGEPKRTPEMTDAEYHRQVERFYGVAPFDEGERGGKTKKSLSGDDR